MKKQAAIAIVNKFLNDCSCSYPSELYAAETFVMDAKRDFVERLNGYSLTVSYEGKNICRECGDHCDFIQSSKWNERADCFEIEGYELHVFDDSISLEYHYSVAKRKLFLQKTNWSSYMCTFETKDHRYKYELYPNSYPHIEHWEIG